MHSSVGSAPSLNTSVVTFGHAVVASIPDSAQMSRFVVPSGSGNSSAGRPRVAPIMKSAQIGSAARAPVMPRPIGRFWSYPTHTPHTRLGVYPTNHASAYSSIVPVLPAAGTIRPRARAG